MSGGYRNREFSIGSEGACWSFAAHGGSQEILTALPLSHGWSGALEQRSTTTQDLRKLTCSRPTNKILQPPAKSKVRHAGYPRPSRRERHRFGPATRNGKPALAGQAPSKARDECLGQGPSPEPLRGGSNRLPLGAANVPPSSNSRVHVRGHGRKMIWHHGAFGGKVPLLRCSRRGHAPRAHVIESRNAGEPTPAASPRDLPHTQEA